MGLGCGSLLNFLTLTVGIGHFFICLDKLFCHFDTVPNKI